ncbi:MULTISPECIES: cell division protein FtsZ [Halomonadaceae]|jgi:cell division protein FtsZ|uniref:Cell division protein FtsZ n=1 Tax=Vreelandella aquamarina TaxID=77097 RepID=A0A0D7UY65_9GAMM|nr:MULTISPECIES: cell division protein FtsZ [Halomonas]KTG25662.1 cell division protein FtsZ [Idiomarina sp. H105]MEC8901592.1 cell division protein FtsZ [Pseudomonadota bacterium]OAE95496.1 cell division protein FtsZ [Idiomarina sp. WRN-38]KJD19496.1 cell division protein FtsZ [Halomonas meridiana]MAG53228.1 cell division protein FtsZ [Halomonas sp.]|tara:strand:- start:948 stop:2129 length:1182 start_codon:yes stop_codon:yes gene_type:complete
MFELVDNAPSSSAVIKVVGVGGGGGNAVNHMVESNIEGVEFICANTDAQALKRVSAKTVLQLGGEITKGLGAGANPEVGRQAALEDRERIAELLNGADMVFITAGMGGGTGTGGAPVVAQVAKELGILTVAVVTRPFPFEGPKRMRAAEEGMKELSEHVDSLITIPNEKLLSVLGKNATLLTAFSAANDVLLGAVQGIAELITSPGIINVDFADVRTVMSEMGMAMMGTGGATGENRAREAAEKAIRSPLLEDIDLHGARGILVNITAGPDLSIGEFNDVGATVQEFASQEATIVVGTSIDMEMSDELRVTVVAAGLDGSKSKAAAREPARRSAADTSSSDYRKLQQPTVMRQQAAARAEAPEAAPKPRPEKRRSADADDYLDIPAFLRRQAD